MCLWKNCHKSVWVLAGENLIQISRLPVAMGENRLELIDIFVPFQRSSQKHSSLSRSFLVAQAAMNTTAEEV